MRFRDTPTHLLPRKTLTSAGELGRRRSTQPFGRQRLKSIAGPSPSAPCCSPGLSANSHRRASVAPARSRRELRRHAESRAIEVEAKDLDDAEDRGSTAPYGEKRRHVQEESSRCGRATSARGAETDLAPNRRLTGLSYQVNHDARSCFASPARRGMAAPRKPSSLARLTHRDAVARLTPFARAMLVVGRPLWAT